MPRAGRGCKRILMRCPLADKPELPVNSGDQVSDTPSILPVAPEAQFRVINQRLDALATEMGKIAKPPTFRVADVVQLLVIVVGIVIAGIAGFGLSERITDFGGNLAEAERRVNASMSAMELRLQAKLDKLSDQFTSMDERASRLEGEKASVPPISPEKNPNAH
jgi:hypothetical protein